MCKGAPIAFFVIAVILTVASCKKTTENYLINGLWRLNYVNLDTSTANYLNKYPNFGGTCCQYNLSFEQSDIVFGWYISNDSVIKLSSGNWAVNSYNQVFLQVDSFADGNFNITRTDLNHWELISNQNHVAAFDNGVNPQFDTCYTKLDMTRI